MELRTICWLEIQGKIKTNMLSPNTIYEAYLVVKFAHRAYGLDSLPSEISLVVGNYESHGIVYLRCRDSNKILSMKEERIPCKREDGWVEIELGEFYNDDGGDDEEVKMSLREVKGHHLKGGLIIEGIEIRPRD